MLGRLVDQISHGEVAIFASRDFEVANFIAHDISSLGTPFRVAEGVIFLQGLAGQSLDYYPANSVPKSCCLHPLKFAIKRVGKRVKEILHRYPFAFHEYLSMNLHRTQFREPS